MKFTLVLVAAVAAIFAATPSSAEARDYCGGERRIVGYCRSGPIYAVYQIIGYDRCGQPIGRWVTQSSYGGGYGSHSGYSSHHGQHRPSHGGYSGSHCAPDYRRSGLNLSFSFGR